RNEERLLETSAMYEGAVRYRDAEKMMSEVRPDILCFATKPMIRLSLISLGIRYGVRSMAFEKPMSVSLREAKQILDLCQTHGVKAIVSHQHKYLTSMRKLKKIVDSGALGEITSIHAGTQAWLSHM